MHLGPAACRVAVESISACKWPCELRFERRYAGKLVPSGTTVFARTLPGKPKGIAQFEKAIFLGKNEASDSFLVGTISGTRVARTVRRSVTPYQAENLMKAKGVPWNFQQKSIGVKLRCQKSMPMLGTVPFVDEDAETVKKTGQEQISSEAASPNRPDAQHCIRELASHLVRPTESQYRQLEHLTCYLKGSAGYAVRLPKTTRGQRVRKPNLEENQQPEEHLLEIFTDSDWGGNKTTRKSVSVAHLYWNGTLIHTLTKTQKAVALSSRESEYVAMTTGASEGVFLNNCIEFLTGKRCRIVLRCDSNSARAFCHRQGVGRVRHISCGLLWPQDLVQQGDLEVKPVKKTQKGNLQTTYKMLRVFMV